MRVRLLPPLVLACLTVFPLIASAENWPSFRGPGGSGVATGKDIPSEFSDKSGILWKLKIPGKGNSSPVIWGDRLFMQTASIDGKERFLLCIDVTKPAILWQRSIPGATAKTHEKNTLASSTPATDGERVYSSFWDGENVSMWAFDFKGDPAWSTPLGSFVSQHGAGASPLLYQDKLFLAHDMDGKSILYCLDKKTGKEVWKKERPAFRACYGVPFILGGEGGRPAELVVTSSTCITSYDPHKGDVIWDWKWDWSTLKKKDFPLRTIAATMHVDGMLFACSGDGGGDRMMNAIALNGVHKDAKPAKVWDNNKNFPYVPCLLHRDGHIFFVNDLGFVGCYEAKTGKSVWYERSDFGKVFFTASPVMIDERIFAVSEAGDVFVFAADAKECRKLGKSSLRELVRASPAVADGRLYIRGAQHLFCIGKK